MRTLILVVLGGIALYFAWPLFRDVDAAGAPGQEDSILDGEGEPIVPATIGTLQSMARMEASEAPEAAPRAAEARSASAEREGPNPETVASAPQEAQAAPKTERARPSDDLDGLDLNALGDPLYEGSLLLHRSDDLQAYLKDRGQGLSKSRKKLLIAYLLVARGQYGQVPKYADGLAEAADVTPEELALLEDAGDGGIEVAREAVRRRHRNPLVLGASMAILERAAGEEATAGRWPEAARLLSDLLLSEVDAPWEGDDPTLRRWARSLGDAQANHRWSPEGPWQSTEVVVEPGDTLTAIRKRVISVRPELEICTGLIERANRTGRYLREDQVLRIPLDPVRTVVDLSARWLYYLHGGEVVLACPVAIGRVGNETTPGRYSVGEKSEEPSWFPTGQPVVPYGDPENPLGTRWIGLDGSQGLGIHGTWEPDTIGSMASDGCIRLLNEQVEELFEVIPRGSEVEVRP